MKQAQWKAAVCATLNDGASWKFKRNLCYRPPGWVLTGALAESSGFRTGAYVWRVVMPLFAPSDQLVLTWSERVLGPSRIIDLDDDAGMSEAIQRATAPFPTERELLITIADRPVQAPNWLPLEAAAYAAVLLGDIRRAVPLLDRVRREVPTRPFEEPIIRRTGQLATLVESGAVEAARSQLRQWRDETVAALGLEPAGLS